MIKWVMVLFFIMENNLFFLNGIGRIWLMIVSEKEMKLFMRNISIIVIFLLIILNGWMKFGYKKKVFFFRSIFFNI